MTGGFGSPVMPGYNLADPRFFNPLGALSQGIGQGVQMGGEIQRQQQLAAMAPLEQQNAVLRNQQLASMTPIQEQEGRLAIAKGSLPIPVVTHSEPVSRNRLTGEIVTNPEGAGAGIPVDTVELEHGYMLDPVTGQKTEFTRPGKIIESAEQAKRGDVQEQALLETSKARNVTANARTMASIAAIKKSGTRTVDIDGVPTIMEPVIGPDGAVEVDPDTGESRMRAVGTDSREYGRRMAEKSKADLNEANAKKAMALAGRQPWMPSNIYEMREAVKTANKYQLDVGTYKELTRTREGNDALMNRLTSLSIAGSGNKPPPDPAIDAIIEKARQQAKTDRVSQEDQAQGSTIPGPLGDVTQKIGTPAPDYGVTYHGGSALGPIPAPVTPEVPAPTPKPSRKPSSEPKDKPVDAPKGRMIDNGPNPLAFQDEMAAKAGLNRILLAGGTLPKSIMIGGRIFDVS